MASYTGAVEMLDSTQTSEAFGEARPSTSDAPAAMRMAYLLSRYPAVSHTFFLQEVLGLRSRGVQIETISINPPDRKHSELSAAEAEEAEHTFYVKGGNRLVALGTLVMTALLFPGVVFRGLAAVFSLRHLSLARRLFWLFYLAEALLIGRWMRGRGLKHLHVHFGGAVASVGMLVGRAWQIPFSLTIHGPEELNDVEAYQLRAKIEAAAFVFCISDFCRSQLCQLVTPDAWNKFHVMRLGVNPVELRPTPRETGTASETRPLELVCTGRLVPAKGHHILLESLALLRDRGLTLHTTLIGGGMEAARLQAFVRAKHLTDHVTFTSALAHAATLAYVRRADIFALASFAEGIPVALMEAMALGVPCVSTTIAGIPELIESGREGLLVPPGNAQALADALASLMSDAKLRRMLGTAGRQRIVSHYNLALNQEVLAHGFAHAFASTASGSAARHAA